MTPVQIDFDELVHETDGAYKVRIGDDTVWLPKYACQDLDEDDGTVVVWERVAVEKGLV